MTERGFDHREFLLHELGHALIHQHQGLVDALRFGEIDWLAEGIAVANAKQRAYLSFYEMRARAGGEALGPVIDPERRKGPLDMRFAYPVWRYFNEYLMTQFGGDAYHRYLVVVAGDPLGWRPIFHEVFGGSFEDEVVTFQDSMGWSY